MALLSSSQRMAWDVGSGVTRTSGGASAYESLSGIDQAQSAAFKILQATIPMQFSSSAAGGGSTMLMNSLNPNYCFANCGANGITTGTASSNSSNGLLTGAQATPWTAAEVSGFGANSVKAFSSVGDVTNYIPTSGQSYASNYYSLNQAYQSISS